MGPDGVWRWPDGPEVALFGANYTIASASAFRFAKATGRSWEQIVDDDFVHFARLGFDTLRLCFWGDWENTSADGALIENEHLAVLDLVVERAGRAGMHCLFSPIVTYDASWPDAMSAPRAGIAHAYAKDKLGTDPGAVAAQARYLGQILSRTNTRTGRRYADEPAIAAVEPINEPTHHSADQAGSIRYIDALASAVRGAGFTGPIFYNISQDMAIAPAVEAAHVNGGTFAWYPTGLQNGRAVEGGLVLVDRYDQLRVPALRHRAKLIYEFDAPDTMSAGFYPAMARSFRQGGAQSAMIFSYDALPIAAANSEFNDHFLNLSYTPAKAISALIAGVAMRELKREGTFDRHRFGGVEVDASAETSSFVDERRFYHAGETTRRPPNPAGLRRLAGCGSSPIVRYDGTGAWFLDRVAPGVWRLELQPDAALITNPFVFRAPSRPAVRIVRRARRLALALSDLGTGFNVATADGHDLGTARGGEVALEPGVYRLTRCGARIRAVDPSYAAPAADQFDPVLLYDPPRSVAAGEPWHLSVQIVAPAAAVDPALHLRTAKGIKRFPLTAGPGFTYTAEVPADHMTAGFLDHYVSTGTKREGQLWPAAEGAWPDDWDFPRRGGFRITVANAGAPVLLWDAAVDGERLLVPYGGYSTFPAIRVVPGKDGVPALRIDAATLARDAHGDLPAQFGWRGTFPGIGKGRRWSELVVEGRSITSSAGVVGVILIGEDGAAWGAPVRLSSKGEAIRVPLAALRPVETAMLPRDFPVGINPYWLRRPAEMAKTPMLEDVRAVQITAGTRFLAAGDDKAPVVEIERVLLK